MRAQYGARLDVCYHKRVPMNVACNAVVHGVGCYTLQCW